MALERVVFPRSLLTGGVTGKFGSVDGISNIDRGDGEVIQVNDMCNVSYNGVNYDYTYLATALAEDGINIIFPDVSPTVGFAWVLQSYKLSKLSNPSGSIPDAVEVLESGVVNINEGVNFGDDTLNKYIKGSYTVTCTPSGSGTVTLIGSKDSFAYTKIGDDIRIQGSLVVDSVNLPVGVLTFNLPETAANLPDLQDSVTGGVATSNVDYDVDYTYVTIFIISNAPTTFSLLQCGSGKANENLGGSVATLKAGDSIRVDFTYRAV